MNWRLDLRKRELLGLFAAFVLGGFAQPWWIFVIVSMVAGAATASRKPRVLIAIALFAGCAWVAAALTQDLVAAGRISKRLSGLFALPFPALLYSALFTIASLLSLFAAMSTRFFTQAIYFGEKP